MPTIPDPVAGTEWGELYGLQINILAATTGVVSHRDGTTIPTPNVRNRDVTGFYDAPWPLILIGSGTYRMDLIASGKPPVVGQNLGKPNLYSIELLTVIPANSKPESEAVANAQSDLIDLQDAIVLYFNHLPNRCLPTPHGSMAKYAGIPIIFRKVPVFKNEKGTPTIVKEGVIGVLGVAQTGFST